ncbi:MAG TPA: hypothetical protein VFY29_08105 [Terriglobia bacterium]|nr:hypothetical protein [Terriglobia bacterium]
MNRLVRYGWLIVSLAAPVAIIGAQNNASAGIEDRFQQFDRKMIELKASLEKTVKQASILTPKALAQQLRALDAVLNDLTRITADAENDLEQLESRAPNQPGALGPAILITLRSRLNAMKEEGALIQKGLNVEDSSFGMYGLIRLPDGRALIRRGPLRHAYLNRELDANPALTVYTLSIFSLGEDGERIDYWTGFTERFGSGEWQDLDIQVSADWRRIGLYRQDKQGAWESEFWCLAKESYELCAGPPDQAPPTPRTLRR